MVAPFVAYVWTMRVAVEICVTSVEEAVAAQAGGADTVEICTWLACGGVTPSSGLVDAVRSAIRIPVRVLVRPSPNGFVYAQAEVHALLTDAEIFGGGAMGLVTGGLSGDGSLKVALMRSVKQLAPESEITFHRAIDHATDPLMNVEVCAELGIDRILTSGGRSLAVEGMPMIKAMIERAGERCTIAIAGGIGPTNVLELVERTGAREVHFAAQRSIPSSSAGPALSSTSTGSAFLTVPDPAKIDGVMNALVKAGLR